MKMKIFEIGPVVICVAILILLPACLGQETVDRLEMLYIGDYIASNPGVVAIESDPLIIPSYVPATTGWFQTDQIARAMRLYLPRTYQVLIEEYDLSVLSDADPWSLPDRWDLYLMESVSKDGLSMLMTGGHRGLGGSGAAREHWDGTRVESVLPVNIIAGSIVGQIGIGATLKPMVSISDDPLMRSLPWQACPFFTEINEVTEKQGAITPFVLDREERNPVISYWDYAEGRALIFASDWHGYGTRAMQHWQFFDDAVINMVYHVSAVQLPPDPIIANQIRTSFKNFRIREGALHAVLEIVEQFGANTMPVRQDLGEVNDIRRAGESLYLSQQYVEALAEMDTALEELSSLEKRAVELQKRALIWIYAIEWLAITGTCMITGFVVYELMIKQRLFREVGATRRKR